MAASSCTWPKAASPGCAWECLAAGKQPWRAASGEGQQAPSRQTLGSQFRRDMSGEVRRTLPAGLLAARRRLCLGRSFRDHCPDGFQLGALRRTPRAKFVKPETRGPPRLFRRIVSGETPAAPQSLRFPAKCIQSNVSSEAAGTATLMRNHHADIWQGGD